MFAISRKIQETVIIKYYRKVSFIHGIRKDTADKEDLITLTVVLRDDYGTVQITFDNQVRQKFSRYVASTQARGNSCLAINASRQKPWPPARITGQEPALQSLISPISPISRRESRFFLLCVCTFLPFLSFVFETFVLVRVHLYFPSVVPFRSSNSSHSPFALG